METLRVGDGILERGGVGGGLVQTSVGVSGFIVDSQQSAPVIEMERSRKGRGVIDGSSQF